MTDKFTFEELTQMAIEYFDSKSLDQIKTMILEMEHFERELFNPVNTTNKSMYEIQALITRRLLSSTPPFPPQLKLFYTGFYLVYLAEWMKYFQIGHTLHLIDNEMLIKQPWKTLTQLQYNLGLTPLFERYPTIFEQGQNGFYCVNNTVRKDMYVYYDSTLPPYSKLYQPVGSLYGKKGLQCLGESKSRSRTKAGIVNFRIKKVRLR